MALPTLPTMAWKIAHRDLPNRVRTWWVFVIFGEG